MYNRTVTLWEMVQRFQDSLLLLVQRKGTEPCLPSWLVGGWRGGKRWPTADGSPLAAWAGSAIETMGCCSAALQRQLHLPTCPPWLPRRRWTRFYIRLECVRCNGIVKLWLSRIIHRVGRNFLLTVFPLSLHLGGNSKDIWTHRSRLVFIRRSFSTLKRSIWWKIHAFGTTCSLRWCGVATLHVAEESGRVAS